jgi:hypothetical protein
MVVEVGVREAPWQLERISRELREQANRGLAKELNAGLRAATQPMMTAARTRMLAVLPKRGGLNRRAAAARMTVTSRRGAAEPGVTIEVRSGRQRIDVGRLDAGSVRHPVFGHRSTWVGQRVVAHTITGSFEDHAEAARREVSAALDRVAAQIDNSGKRGL